MQTIYKDINEADSIIFATPVFLWQMTAQLKIFIDRLYAYLKQDFTSFLSSKKNFMFVVSCGGGNISDYANYFEYSSKSLQSLGFGEYKIFIAGGTNSLEELMENREIIAEAH
jgi:multimeric flavodoxin WrbA